MTKTENPNAPLQNLNPEFMTVLYSDPLQRVQSLAEKNETANPCPPKSKMQPREGQNGQFPIFDLGGGEV